MDNIPKETFIKATGNKAINLKFIRWIKKMDDCIYICSMMNGCDDHNLHKVCKFDNNDSYNKLNKHFE